MVGEMHGQWRVKLGPAVVVAVGTGGGRRSWEGQKDITRAQFSQEARKIDEIQGVHLAAEDLLLSI